MDTDAAVSAASDDTGRPFHCAHRFPSSAARTSSIRALPYEGSPALSPLALQPVGSSPTFLASLPPVLLPPRALVALDAAFVSRRADVLPALLALVLVVLDGIIRLPLSLIFLMLIAPIVLMMARPPPLSAPRVARTASGDGWCGDVDAWSVNQK